MAESSNLPYTFSLSTVTTYQAGVMQSSMHRLLQKESDEYLQEFGITKMQWLIIGTVFDAGSEGIRITELSQIMQTGLPYLTTTVNLLESKGILCRSSTIEDGRSKAIIVSEDFREKCPEIEKTPRERLRTSIYSKVDPADFSTYMKVVYQLGQSPE